MFRRERFVVATGILMIAFVGVLLVSAQWRIPSIAIFSLAAYLLSGWALRQDLQWWETITILPLPAMYSLATSWFYVLVPANLVSQVLLTILFGVGMYALLLAGNIFSVAKARTIQLVHAAQAFTMLVTLFSSALLSNSALSLPAPWYLIAPLITLLHLPLVLTNVWAARVTERLTVSLAQSVLVVLWLLLQTVVALSFLPLTIWHRSLFIMSTLYILVGLVQAYRQQRLFAKTYGEYAVVSMVVIGLFIWLFPGK